MEQIMEVLGNLPLEQIAAVVGVLSIIAAFTPTPVDDGILAALRKILNLGAMNIGQAENKYKPGDGQPRPKRKFGPRK